MPLIKSSSPEAFSQNVAEMIRAGHQQNQALAAAYRIKRQRRAIGGLTNAGPTAGPGAFNLTPKQMIRRETSTMTHSGPIMSFVGGRTDHHPMAVRSGSYVLPADHVSSLGQGNTANGMAVLNKMFASGPYGISSMKIPHGIGAPRRRAKGGSMQGDGSPVPIYAAGGEYVIPPEKVMEIGGGDLKRGHAILDAWVRANRKKHIQTLKRLPGPAKK